MRIAPPPLSRDGFWRINMKKSVDYRINAVLAVMRPRVETWLLNVRVSVSVSVC